MIQQVEQVEFNLVVRLLVFALDNRFSTKPIVELLGRCPAERIRHPEMDLQAFLEWCNSISFKAETNTVGEVTPPIDNVDSSPEREQFFEKARQMGAAVGDAMVFAESHKYWYFRPAWEIDTPVSTTAAPTASREPRARTLYSHE